MQRFFAPRLHLKQKVIRIKYCTIAYNVNIYDMSHDVMNINNESNGMHPKQNVLPWKGDSATRNWSFFQFRILESV